MLAPELSKLLVLVAYAPFVCLYVCVCVSVFVYLSSTEVDIVGGSEQTFVFV